jgi:C1A family cysteine protease
LINELKIKPVAVGISGFKLQFYKSGLFDDCSKVIDHAVLVVGYKSGYGWKIKNSWGKDWGDKGFFWLADGNSCGVC